MSINIIPINGRNSNFDYEKFESSVRKTLEKTCQNCKIFLFNNFPVTISVDSQIDLLVVISIENIKGNYLFTKKIDDYPIYFQNQIIPIVFVNDLIDDNINLNDKKQIESNEIFIDYSNEINSLKYGLINYLKNKCSFSDDELYIEPIIFIKNKNNFVKDNYIVGDKFDFYKIFNLYRENSIKYISSYKKWSTEIGYKSIQVDIEKITNQAQFDSKIGYLTKKKIDRISKLLSTTKSIYDELNSNLIIINGKAGTGKSSELLLLSMKCLLNKQNTYYLTYNKLLIFEIAKTISAFRNNKSNNNIEIGQGLVKTLHSFFYKLSKTLGVLHILSAERIENLLTLLNKRMRIVFDFITEEIKSTNELKIEDLKSKIQNSNRLDIPTKEVGIDLLNYIKKVNLISKENFNSVSKQFYEYKKRLIANINANDVFLADYYGVLENTLLQIDKPEEFYVKHNVKDKFDLLDLAIGLNKENFEEIDGKRYVTEKGLKTTTNRRVGGLRRKSTIFIDEAQDCHRLEKEILISIFKSQNIVVANGGKEQLIRHTELCDWTVSKALKLSVKNHPIRNKSYRIKKTLVDFCNFISNKYQIKFNLEPYDTEDNGELIVDFRKSHNQDEITNLFNQFSLKGDVYGYTPYESILVLIEANTQRKNVSNSKTIESGIINEYGNIEDNINLSRGNWQHLKSLEDKDFMFWDGTLSDKKDQIPPNPNEIRIIHYESCRGLEANSVACFGIDKFFELKRNDPDAEKYLIEDLFLNQNNEQRKSMFAATWTLMSLTRAIDTQYIQINDENSEFGKIVCEYINTKKENIKVLK